MTNATRCPSISEEPRPIISVDMKKMSKILSFNAEDGVAHVEAGIVGRDLVEELERRGFTMGHEPDSIEFSTLGGWIATKASGMKRGKYGNIEDIVRAVRMVGSEGLIRKDDKSYRTAGEPAGRVAEGLDLRSFAIGSEGCLGIITSAVIRIWPVAEVKQYESVLLPNFEIGVQFIRDVTRLGANIPASVRLLDNDHFRLGQALQPQKSSIGQLITTVGSKVMSAVHGNLAPNNVVCATISFEGSPSEVKSQRSEIKNLAQQYSGLLLGQSVGKAGYDLTFMIAYLRDFALSFNLLGESFETFVPWSKVEELIPSVKERILREHKERHLPGRPFMGCRITQLYHEGACLYFYLCIDIDGVPNGSQVFSELEHAARDEIVKHGGSLSHHHGLGKAKAEFLQDRWSPAFQEVLASTKVGFDKDNIFGARNGAFATLHDGNE